MTRTEKYEKLRNNLKTGDIVLFAGKGWIGRIIRWATQSRWTHVGMVYRPIHGGQVFLYESTSLSKKNGVQTVDLKSRIDSYDGQIAIRYLEGEPLQVKHIQALEAVRDDMRGRKYERSVAELAKSTLGRWGLYQKKDNSSQFCSELVAYCLQGMALLKLSRTPNSYTPRDFAKSFYLNDGRRYSNLDHL